MAAAQLEAGVKELKQIQEDIRKLVASRQQLLVQINENEMVKKELELLEKDAAVYRLIGPVLLKQEPEEAKMNVVKRLEFLQGEMKKSEQRMQELQKKLEDKRVKLAELQRNLAAQRQA